MDGPTEDEPERIEKISLSSYDDSFIFFPVKLGSHTISEILWCWLFKRGDYSQEFEEIRGKNHGYKLTNGNTTSVDLVLLRVNICFGK